MKFRAVAAAALMSMSLGFPMAAYAQNAEITAQIQAAAGDLDNLIKTALDLAEKNSALLAQIVGDAVVAAPGDEAEVAAAFAKTFSDSAVAITTASVGAAPAESAGAIAGAIAAEVPGQALDVAAAAALVQPTQSGNIVAQVSVQSGVGIAELSKAVADATGQDAADVEQAANDAQAGQTPDESVEAEEPGSES